MSTPIVVKLPCRGAELHCQRTGTVQQFKEMKRAQLFLVEHPTGSKRPTLEVFEKLDDNTAARLLPWDDEDYWTDTNLPQLGELLDDKLVQT